MPLPYFLKRDKILEHVLIQGITGIGKTSQFVGPIVENLAYIAARKRDASILLIDLKGDDFLFNYSEWIARQSGLPFRFFSTKRGRCSFGFNPFTQTHFRDRISTNQAAEVLVNAFGMNFADDVYGGSYFRDMCLVFMRSVVHMPEINSFAMLYRFVKEHPELLDMSGKAWDDVSHIIAVLDAVARVEPLNITPDWCSKNVLDEAIDVCSILEEPQIVYFYLPTILESRLCAGIAKLLAFMILTAASQRTSRAKNKLFLVIDEYQKMAGEDFRVFVQMARGFSIGCLLSSQSQGDLDAVGQHFSSIIHDNTGTKIVLSAISRAQKELAIDSSPLGISYKQTYHADGSISQTEEVNPSLDNNDLTDITAEPLEGLIQTHVPAGLTQVRGQVRFRTNYRFPIDQYKQMKNQELPHNAEDHPGTIVVRGEKPAGKEPIRGSVPVQAPERDTANGRQKSLPRAEANGESTFQKRAARILRDPLSPDDRNGSEPQT